MTVSTELCFCCCGELHSIDQALNFMSLSKVVVHQKLIDLGDNFVTLVI